MNILRILTLIDPHPVTTPEASSAITAPCSGRAMTETVGPSVKGVDNFNIQISLSNALL